MNFISNSQPPNLGCLFKLKRGQHEATNFKKHRLRFSVGEERIIYRGVINVEARSLEHEYPRVFKAKYRKSQHQSS